MTDFFSAETADEVWKQAYTRLVAKTDQAQESRLGSTRESLHANFHITDPRQRWILSRLPALNPAFAIAEVFWILSGDNSSRFINYWNPKYPSFAGNGLKYHGAYGHRIRCHFEFDQLERAYLALKHNPSSRQVVIQIWDSNADFPTPMGKPLDPDIPCNICSMPKVRDGKLEWLQIMRSNDLYLGTPHNFVQFTSMQEVLAGWLGLGLGAYHQISDSLHVYEKDLSDCTCCKETFPKNSDSLSIPKNKFDSHMEYIIPMLHELTIPSLTKETFMSIVASTSLSRSYKNLLLICAADSARRRGWDTEMNASLDQCENPLLKKAFHRWLKRKPIRRNSSNSRQK